MYPAARIGDPITHDYSVPSGVIAPAAPAPCPQCGTMPVMIEGLPAAHVGCTAVCTGATGGGTAHSPVSTPQPIAQGSATVFIHGKPAVGWYPTSPTAACGACVGDPKLTPIRSVFLGG